MPMDLRGGVATTRNKNNMTTVGAGGDGVLGVEGMQKLNELIQRKAQQRTQKERLEPLKADHVDAQLAKQKSQLEYAAYFTNNQD